MHRLHAILFVFLNFQHTDGKLVSLNITYAFVDNLTKPSYNLPNIITIIDDNWPFSSIARDVRRAILRVTKPLPFRNFMSEDGKLEPNVSALLLYETPLLIPSILALQASLAVPCIIIFFLKRRNLISGKHIRRKKPQRLFLVLLILVISALIGGSFSIILPLIGERVWSVSGVLAKATENSLKDFTVYKTTLLKNLREVVVNDLQSYITAVRSEVLRYSENVANAAMTNIPEGRKITGQQFHDSLTNLIQLITSKKQSELDIQNKGLLFSRQINATNSQISEIKSTCQSNNLDFCEWFLQNISLNVISDEMLKIENVDQKINTAFIKTIDSTKMSQVRLKMLNIVEQYVYNNTPGLLQNVTLLELAKRRYEYHVDRIERQIDWGQSKLELQWYIDAVSNFNRHVRQRRFQRGVFMYSLTIAIMVFMSSVAVAVIASICSTGDNYHSASKVGYKVLYFAMVYGSFLAMCLFFITIFLFLVGTHLQLLCRSLDDKSIFRDFIDLIYPIEHFIYGKGCETKIPAENVLSKCRKDWTIYSSLNGSNHFDIKKSITSDIHFSFALPSLKQKKTQLVRQINSHLEIAEFFKKQITNLSSVLENTTINMYNDTELLHQHLRKYFIPSVATMNSDIYQLSIQHNKGMFSKAHDQLIFDIIAKSQKTLKQLKAMQIVYDDLFVSVNDTITQNIHLVTAVAQLTKTAQNISKFLENDANNRSNVHLSIGLTKDFVSHMPVISQYAKNVHDQVVKNIGGCRILTMIFDAFYISVCDRGTDSVTVLWAILAFIIGIIIVMLYAAAKLLTYFEYYINSLLFEIENVATRGNTEVINEGFENYSCLTLTKNKPRESQMGEKESKPDSIIEKSDTTTSTRGFIGRTKESVRELLSKGLNLIRKPPEVTTRDQNQDILTSPSEKNYDRMYVPSNDQSKKYIKIDKLNDSLPQEQLCKSTLSNNVLEKLMIAAKYPEINLSKSKLKNNSQPQPTDNDFLKKRIPHDRTMSLQKFDSVRENNKTMTNSMRRQSEPPLRKKPIPENTRSQYFREKRKKISPSILENVGESNLESESQNDETQLTDGIKAFGKVPKRLTTIRKETLKPVVLPEKF